MPQTGGSDKLWIYLSWDETCVHTLGAASANRFNAPLNWRVIKKSQKRQRVWRESQTLRGFCSVSDVWNLNAQPRPWPCEENGFRAVRFCIMQMDSSSSWLQVTPLLRLANSSERGCRDPPDPCKHPTSDASAQFDGYLCKQCWEQLQWTLTFTCNTYFDCRYIWSHVVLSWALGTCNIIFCHSPVCSGKEKQHWTMSF